MKKTCVILCLFIGLSGCDYIQEKRNGFYKMCLSEHIHSAKSIVDKMLTSCACEQWSLRKDIRPKNKKIASKQYNEEKQKCYTTPMKHMNVDQRRFCNEGFIKKSPSAADIAIRSGVAPQDVALVGVSRPEIYKRDSNKKSVECGCERLSHRYGFVIPSSDDLLKKEVDKEIKKCNEPPVWSQFTIKE